MEVWNEIPFKPKPTAHDPMKFPLLALEIQNQNLNAHHAPVSKTPNFCFVKSQIFITESFFIHHSRMIFVQPHINEACPVNCPFSLSLTSIKIQVSTSIQGRDFPLKNIITMGRCNLTFLTRRKNSGKTNSLEVALFS